MALLWCDIPDRSDGLYGTDTSLMNDGLWAQLGDTNLVDDPDPNIGSAGKVAGLYTGPSDIAIMRWILPGLRNEVGMGCRVFLGNIPIETDREVEIHTYRNASNTVMISIVISTTGSIQVCQGDRGDTVLAESAQDVISANAWRHIESEVVRDASAGTVKVWVEGVEVINATGLNTGATDISQVAFTSRDDATGNGTFSYAKDIFIRDGLGTVNNGKIGTTTVYLLRPNADVSSGWTRSSGTTDYELIDGSPPVDTDYISANDTPPAPSIMELENLPTDIVGVRGLISVSRSIKTDSGDGNLQVSLSPNGTDWDAGADNAVTTSYTYSHDVSELSPATSSSWTPTEVNSTQIRLDRTT